MNKYLGKVSEKALVSSAELVMKNRALYGFLKAKYVNLTSAFCLNILPEQGEDIYTLLVNGQEILLVELSRVDHSLAEIESLPLDIYLAQLKDPKERKFILSALEWVGGKI